MRYNHVFIDVFNLHHRLKNKSLNNFARANNVVDYILDVKNKLEPGGDIYLLFDPLPKVDLIEKSTFRNQITSRQEINKDYKSNRIKDPEDLIAISMVFKYFEYRGEIFKSVKNQSCEADDFVESLVNSLEGTIALVSTDLDWAKYISDRVYFINGSWDKPMTKDEFKERFGYNPSVLFLTLYKAAFGDDSDNIKALDSIKKVFYYKDLTKSFKDYFEQMDHTESVDSFVRRFFSKNIAESIANSENSAEDNLFSVIATGESRYGDPLKIFKDNIRLIRCRCKDANKYVTWKNENSRLNKAIDSVLGRACNENRKFKFGGVRVL